MYTDNKRTPENFHKRAETIRALVKSNPAFGELYKFLHDMLASEREEFESNVANEHTRGRIDMLKHIIKIINGDN